MAKDWTRVSIGELLRLERRPVKVFPDQLYAEIGTYSFGRGIFHKQPRSGLEVGSKDLFLIKEGDFILQITFAWEGAVALASSTENDMYGSIRFPTFRVDEARCDPRFLVNYFKTQEGLFQLGKISPGSAGRNRVLSLQRISEVFVPLPPLLEQQRIVARVDALARRVEEARGLRRAAVQERQQLLQGARNQVFSTEGETSVGDFVNIQSGYAFKSDWFTVEGIRLVRNVNIGHGYLEWDQVAYIPESRRSEFSNFELSEGDILVSLDRPIISTGVKVARVSIQDLPSLLLQRVGRVQFFSGRLSPEFFFSWLQSPRFSYAINPGRSNGVPHISPLDIEHIPFAPPPLDEQRRIVSYLDGLQAKVDELRRLQAETQKELDALMPSILAKAFAGEL